MSEVFASHSCFQKPENPDHMVKILYIWKLNSLKKLDIKKM